MDRPRVSVIIPVHNGAEFVGRAIESVLAQTYDAVEIVAVDDGSTDESADVVRGFAGRVTLVSQSNLGVSRARNAGVNASSGTLVAFLDQDDWWRPSKVELQVARFSDPEVGLVHTNVAHFDEDARTYVGRLTAESISAALVGRTFDRLVLGNGIYNSSVMLRRDLFERVGGLNVDMPGNTVQDYDLWLRLSRVCAFAYVPEEVTVFRIHGQQGTWKRAKMLRAELEVLARIVGPESLLADPARRRRIAALLDELAREEILSGDRPAARATIRRLMRTRPTARSVALVALSWMPPALSRRVLGHSTADRPART